MPVAGVDAAQIVATLNRHKVAFVVIGGFAVELWDVAVQPTLDVDITPDRSEDNLARLADALNELDARIRFGSESISIPGGFTRRHIEEMMVLNLSTSSGPLDISMAPAGTGGYEDLALKMSEIEYHDILVPTASLADVARSKEAAGRPKDLKVLPAILAHLNRRRPN